MNLSGFILTVFPERFLEQLPILMVVIPLIAAVIASVSFSRKIAWLITMLTSLTVLVFSVVLYTKVINEGVISYLLGGWGIPLGIEYRIDGLNAAILVLVSFISVLCSVYAYKAVCQEIEYAKHPAFYSAFLVCLTGLLGLAITGDAFNLFVFLEISSLSTYILIAMGARRDRRALISAYNYLILGSIGATFFVIGVGFLYMSVGTLNMMDIATRLEGQETSRVVQTAFAFIVIGLSLKVAIFPMHMWLPGAYAHSPVMISAFLASTATKVALYVLVRFIFNVFHADQTFDSLILIWLLAPLGAASMLAGSFQAIFQKDVGRILAFSSIAQIGYMLLGIGIATQAGLYASFLHLLNHALMKGTLFMALGAATLAMGVVSVNDFKGLGRVIPWTMGAFTIGALSLIGIPGTAGFVSKLALIYAALEKGWYWAVIVIVISSVLALIYLGVVLEKAYLHDPPEREGKDISQRRVFLWLLIPMWVLAISNLIFGINTQITSGLAKGMVNSVMTVLGASS